jgi:Gas vesicle synthesis protein GvpL/GvpF
VRLKEREAQTRSPQSVARRAAISRSLKANAVAKPVPRPVAPPVDVAHDQARRRTMGKYVYCIIREAAPIAYGPIGLGADPADVYTIARGDLAAVVSDAPLEVLDPTRDNVLAHQRVNETVMKQHTVLPMSFGTVFKTHDDVVELLRSASEAFSDVLNKMEAKLEFGLKVVWDRDAIIREIEQEDEDIRRVKAELQAHKGSTYFARMQYGRLVDAALQAKSEQYVADTFAALRGASVAARSNKLIGERMILNAAFLVNRRDAREFDRCVKALGARYDKLTYKYTGPWPPYNFVNIRLKLERA